MFRKTDGTRHTVGEFDRGISYAQVEMSQWNPFVPITYSNKNLVKEYDNWLLNTNKLIEKFRVLDVT
jgi:hypothetical protein